ncbi:hypothetical protein HN51_015669 [Arachis hypogaea]
MADHIQQSSADQRKNAQLIADAIIGVNKKWKVGEKLTQLGFGDDEVVRAILKFAESPNVYAHFWGLSDSQMMALLAMLFETCNGALKPHAPNYSPVTLPLPYKPLVDLLLVEAIVNQTIPLTKSSTFEEAQIINFMQIRANLNSSNEGFKRSHQHVGESEEKQWRPDTQLRDGGDADPPAWIHQQRHKLRVATRATKMNQGELERRHRGSHHWRCYRRRVRL